MALINVRPKNDPDGEVVVVDEAWLDRWPDDFERVEDATEAPAAPTTPQKQTGGQPAGDAGDRGRF